VLNSCRGISANGSRLNAPSVENLPEQNHRQGHTAPAELHRGHGQHGADHQRKDRNMRKTIRQIETVSNLAMNTSVIDITRLVHQRMASALAAAICEAQAEKTVHDFHTEFKLELIVATPSDYWRDVEQKALELSRRFASHNIETI
jgi:hypothetical protein